MPTVLSSALCCQLRAWRLHRDLPSPRHLVRQGGSSPFWRGGHGSETLATSLSLMGPKWQNWGSNPLPCGPLSHLSPPHCSPPAKGAMALLTLKPSLARPSCSRHRVRSRGNADGELQDNRKAAILYTSALCAPGHPTRKEEEGEGEGERGEGGRRDGGRKRKEGLLAQPSQ